MPLGELPTLPQLGQAISSGSPETAAVSMAESVAKNTAGSLGTGGTIAGVSITKIVLIALGLILIAAGIFSFKETRQILVTAGKAAAA